MSYVPYVGIAGAYVKLSDPVNSVAVVIKQASESHTERSVVSKLKLAGCSTVTVPAMSERRVIESYLASKSAVAPFRVTFSIRFLEFNCHSPSFKYQAQISSDCTSCVVQSVPSKVLVAVSVSPLFVYLF